ncbi:uncharacterized protein LOC124268990 [Haliotis rubra]|uniref:uncharacterized protein LOC124268990 n=1 Tax=Haliotis rubra TaxID=36100 RepID=UPI001EE53E3E|nr:uncharacterized protein LOC124268990 [Haliotis rubra]
MALRTSRSQTTATLTVGDIPPLLSYCICWNMRDHRYFPVNYADTKVFHSKAGGKQGKSQHSKNHIHSTQYSKNTAFEYNSPANKSVHVRFNPCDNFLETYKLIKSHCNEHFGGGVYKCRKCHKMFRLFPDLNTAERHVRITKEEPRRDKCGGDH